MALTIKSGAFEHGGEIPRKYTCDGEDLSPALEWSGVPEGARTLCLVCSDPDAPTGTFTHWVLANIPADRSGLPEGVSPLDLEEMGVIQGANDFGKTEYGGPCPPPGPDHRYYFRLAALDAAIEATSGDRLERIMSKAEENVIETAELIGRYGRS